ncbi:prepilin peptidase [Campylobacter sp. RM12920]|uniref:Prepilin peptidase n=1 Tax=Campylobacter californiensis TaxID=1032243 RepID=A0ABD4JL79_9BACT|nr:prepilin peptidase [Campylobacter sp. RM12919]MBE2988821.1 prepilin peptidase [Campylobacter sp. RM12920]
MFEIYAIVFAVFGLCMGSFANVLIYRLPRQKSINFPPSSCPKCDHKLKFYHNIPVFSWFFLRAKCAFCNSKISPIYPLVEICSCALMLVSFFGECVDFIDVQSLFRAFALGVCLILLLALSLIDLEFKAVPDSLLFSALGFALLFAASEVFCEFDFSLIINSICLAIVFWLLRFILSAAMKREAMGSADIFIAAIIGAILPLNLALLAIYTAAVLTLPAYLIIRKKDYELAFVPFLSLGLVLVYIFKEEYINFIGFLYE